MIDKKGLVETGRQFPKVQEGQELGTLSAEHQAKGGAEAVFLTDPARTEPTSCAGSLCRQRVLTKFNRERKLEALSPQRRADRWGMNVGCN